MALAAELAIKCESTESWPGCDGDGESTADQVLLDHQNASHACHETPALAARRYCSTSGFHQSRQSLEPLTLHSFKPQQSLAVGISPSRCVESDWGLACYAHQRRHRQASPRRGASSYTQDHRGAAPFGYRDGVSADRSCLSALRSSTRNQV